MLEEELAIKAEELKQLVINQINSFRREIADNMIKKGLTPDKWVIVDNAEEVLQDPTVPYQYYVNPIWEDIEIKQ